MEFDDPEYLAEEEKVAKLVSELSQSPTRLESEEAILSASPSENLLPPAESDFQSEDEYRRLLENSRSETPASSATSSPGTTTIAIDASDVKVYSELTNVLADMGKLTEAIAASTRAVQANPTSADAYRNLGGALYEQGYLVEAIAAYNQAIRLNPKDASAHNRLGLALYQQGKLNEAIQSYHKAIQLDPALTDADTNLRAALSQQSSVQPISQLSITLKDHGKTQKATASSTSPGKSRRIFLWSGLGAIAVSAILGVWIFYDDLSQMLPGVPTPSVSPSSSPSKLDDLQRVNTEALTALATEQLRQGNLSTVQNAVETLLDRGKLTEAESVLKAIPNPSAQNPTINFLKGRLAWESWLAGNKNYSASTARQLWETAAKGQPNALYQNALGFAYYAEGKLEQAEQAWLQALRLAGDATAAPAQPQPNNSPNPEVLTARAGLAMVWVKRAERGSVTEQAVWRSKALELRQRILSEDEVNFRPEVLLKNWMWSEKAIQDWRSLLAMK
ncbi:MAG: tetratricopeptide repeat protein [Leptolyngbyaceae cyanobacterium RU_5_1]|nr:tetratricopeptide repeat protein [Leptolyngbyaceae cyanobacterium RU_5_1]